jgi:hypothetical protein
VDGRDEAQRHDRGGDSQTRGGINARPSLLFKLRLAGHLGKTLAEIDQMDSREFSTWIAYSRWFRPLNDSWMQMAMLATCELAPHTKKTPSPEQFIPIDTSTPQHWTQIHATIAKMKADLEG